jgi:hypothetical protein
MLAKATAAAQAEYAKTVTNNVDKGYMKNLILGRCDYLLSLQTPIYSSFFLIYYITFFHLNLLLYLLFVVLSYSLLLTLYL